MGIDGGEVTAWEAGERFPTKKHVNELERLRERGPSAIVRLKRKRATPTPPATGFDLLADSALWLLVRKLVAYPEFFEQVQELAARLPDPAAAEAERKG